MDSDNISEISDIDDDENENQIKNFTIRKYSKESSDDDCSSEKTYDSFNTSDSEILKKEEIKIKLLNEYGLVNNDNLLTKSKEEFNLLFLHMLREIKKETNLNDKIKLKPLDNSDDDSNDSGYLHGFKFF